MSATERRTVRPKESPETWRDRVERWKASGLGAKEFAAAENLSPYSLSWWKWRLQRQSEGPVVSKQRARRSKATPAPMDVILPGDVRVRVHAGFDEASLLRLVRVLESR